MPLKALLTALLCLLCIPVHAEVYWTPDKLPMVHLQDATRYVVNPDGVLLRTTVDSLDRELALLEKETGVQTVVIVVRHIEGDDPYSFGQAIADRYGIGHKGRDDGLIVLLCSDDRSYSILTGDGLEGVLPDAVCYRVEQQVMVPLLKQGRWDEALLATVDVLDRCIRKDPEMNAYSEADDSDWIYGLFVFIFMTVLVVVCVLASKTKCPNCHKRKLKFVQIQKVVVNGSTKQQAVYICKKCGHITHRDVNNAPAVGGGYHGGYYGGYRGGSSGGSFGGGHFSGGGSSGRF